jgi:hypothetical protein
MKNKIILWIGIIFIFSLVNCTSKSVLVGSWILDENHDIIFEFIKGGSGFLHTDVGFARLTWGTTEDDFLTINGTGLDVDGTYKYKVIDSILTLTNDNFEVKFNKIWK